MTNKNIYTKVAEHHDSLSAEHADMHKHTKAKHEAMDDTDEHKAFFGKLASHHEKCMKLHKSHSEFMHAAAEATPINNHGDAGESVKMILTDEDLVKSFTGADDAVVPAISTTASSAFAPAKGPTFAPPLGQAIEMPAELAHWTD